MATEQIGPSIEIVRFNFRESSKWVALPAESGGEPREGSALGQRRQRRVTKPDDLHRERHRFSAALPLFSGAKRTDPGLLCWNTIETQREVGRDVLSFADGLRFGLRQDPDVILVGEIRDIDTARMALSAAETGHLVFSTLHTRDAKGAISRYADFFPQQVQGEVRSQLATGIRAVICQRLLPSNIEGEKQELALEILFNTPAIGAAIRIGKLESIDNYIVTGRAEGMISMDESIKRLLSNNRISRATAESFISDRTLISGL